MLLSSESSSPSLDLMGAAIITRSALQSLPLMCGGMYSRLKDFLEDGSFDGGLGTQFV